MQRWQDKDESGNFWQKYDPELVKEEVRPLVFEEIRQEVDEEMRVLLANLVEMVEAERAAQKGGKYKKKKKKKKKGKGKKKGGKGKGKKYKDLTADRDPVSLFTELVTNGIVKPLSRVGVSDFIGAASPVSGEMAQAIEPSEPSMAQVGFCIGPGCLSGTGAPHRRPLLRAR